MTTKLIAPAITVMTADQWFPVDIDTMRAKGIAEPAAHQAATETAARAGLTITEWTFEISDASTGPGSEMDSIEVDGEWCEVVAIARAPGVEVVFPMWE